MAREIPDTERAKYVRPVLRAGGGGTMGVELYVPCQWVATVAIEMGLSNCKMAGVIELPADPQQSIVTLVPFCQLSKIEPKEVLEEVRLRVGTIQRVLTEGSAVKK